MKNGSKPLFSRIKKKKHLTQKKILKKRYQKRFRALFGLLWLGIKLLTF